MAEPTLQLRLTQKLALSPQLQQAIRLLQLNRIELREYVQEVLDANPILERSEGEPDAGSSEFEAPESADADRPSAEEPLSEWDYESPASDPWPESSGFEGFSGEPQIADTSTDSLRDHLLWQINLSHFSPTDTVIAQAIVFGIDEDGYLEESIDEIRASLAPELLVDEDEILAVLHRVQRLEPVGVATRDPAECIRVQLAALPSDTGGRDLALRIARDYLDLVAQHDLDELARQTGAGEQPLQTALEINHARRDVLPYRLAPAAPRPQPGS